MKNIIWKLYHFKNIGLIFHSLVATLREELKNCETILDLGCGPSSPLRYCKAKYSVGVDAYIPYIKESRELKIHDRYINEEITKLSIKPKSYDAVILIDVLEHLTKSEGNRLIKNMEKWAKKKVIINTPNGYLPAYDSANHYQSHKSGWDVEEMKKKGYKAYGMAGLKFLRKKTAPDNTKNECFVTMRFRPRSFWFLVSGLSQLITYHFPKHAFEVLYIKHIHD